MQAKELQEKLYQLLDDAKAKEIQVLDVSKISTITDFMVIATGTSSRHVSAVASNLIDSMKSEGIRAWGTEGQETGEWVLVDFGDVIVHIMQAEARDFYLLEKLWSGTETESMQSGGEST